RVNTDDHEQRQNEVNGRTTRQRVRHQQPSINGAPPYATTTTKPTSDKAAPKNRNLLKRIEEWNTKTTERIQKTKDNFRRKLICFFTVLAKIFYCCCMGSIRKQLDEMNKMYDEEETVVKDMEEADEEEEEERRSKSKLGKHRREREESPKRHKPKKRRSVRDSEEESDSEIDEEASHKDRRSSTSQESKKITSERILDQFDKRDKQQNKKQVKESKERDQADRRGFWSRFLNSTCLNLTIWISAIAFLAGLAAILTNNTNRAFIVGDNPASLIISIILILGLSGIAAIAALVIYALFKLVMKPYNWCCGRCSSLFGAFSSKVLE